MNINKVKCILIYSIRKFADIFNLRQCKRFNVYVWICYIERKGSNK